MAPTAAGISVSLLLARLSLIMRVQWPIIGEIVVSWFCDASYQGNTSIQYRAVIMWPIFPKILSKDVFLDLISDLYSAPITAVIYAISCYIGPCCNGTQLYVTLEETGIQFFSKYSHIVINPVIQQKLEQVEY